MPVADTAFWLFNPSPPWSIMVYGVPCEAGPALEQQINELVVYLQGDYEIPLRELRYPKESSYGCHQYGSYEEIVEMTAELKRRWAPIPTLLTMERWTVASATRCTKNHR